MVKPNKKSVANTQGRSFLIWKFSISSLVILALILSNSLMVRADISYFYSPLCLGGWKYPKNVQGEPQIPIGADATAFNESNSAILHNSNSQIFCGQFSSNNPPTKDIKSVWLVLSLAIESKIKEVPSSDFETGKTIDTPADQIQTFILGPTPPPETEQTLPTPSESSAPESSEPTPMPVDSEPSTSFLNWVVPTAHAEVSASSSDSSSSNLNDLLEIRYTKDGVEWQTLGTINRDTWKGQPFQIPVSSLDEISNLQISINSLPGLDNETTVYLDSIWIQAEYNSGFVDFIKDIGETIIETLTLQNLAQPTDEPTPTVSPTETPTPTPTTIKIIEYKFRTESESQAKIDLPWYDRETSNKALTTSSSLPHVSIGAGLNNSLRISGQCRDKYFVILIYRNADDYEKNPASSVYNSAFPCEGGRIDHTLAELPNVESGHYYMLIGEQGDKGGWIPISNIVRINLTATEKEITQ